MKNLLVFLALAVSFHVSGYPTALKSYLSISQESNTNTGFSFLRGHKQGNSGYALQWSMTSSASIDRYEIQCTYEDPNDEYSNWSTVGTAINNRSNIVKFTHQSVMPGFISYRVIAVLGDGRSTITSGIHSTTIE